MSFKLKSVITAVKEFIKPCKRGLGYYATKIDLSVKEPIKLGEKPILLMIKPDSNKEKDKRADIKR